MAWCLQAFLDFPELTHWNLRVVGYQVFKPAGSPKKTMMVFLTEENYG